MACLLLASQSAAAGVSFVGGPSADGPPVGAIGGSRPDSIPHGPRPFSVMLRSAAIPGWGQAANRKYVKSLAVVAGEGFLAYKAWSEFEKEKDALDRHDEAYQAAIDRGDPYPDLDPAVLAAENDRNVHLNRKVNWIWWGVAAHMLNMIDAYVDAHLATFEADFGPPDAAAPGEGEPRLTLAVRARF
ncbi:MAG: hypothetical protein HY568_01890 [Candidatus Latescibacteria bacterium]|nr:hypothetical protein [Candidatus Latescibacterota bacterium]